jgi:hypothetical protein
MEGYRASMCALVEHTCSGRPLPTRASASIPEPEAVSLAGWRPGLSYFVCAPTAQLGASLGAELAKTGVAGIPEACFGSHQRWTSLRGSEFALFLAKVMEAGATPNSVFGAVIVPGDGAALVARLQGGQGVRHARAGERLSTEFPNLHYVWILAARAARSRVARGSGTAGSRPAIIASSRCERRVWSGTPPAPPAQC